MSKRVYFMLFLVVPLIYLAIFTTLAIVIYRFALPAAGVLMMTTASACFVFLSRHWARGKRH